MFGSDVHLSGLHVYSCRAACPVCGERVEGGGTGCPLCSTPHHSDCWRYAGGCAMYACGVDEELRRSTPERQVHPLDWFLAPTNPDRAVSARALYPFMLTMLASFLFIVFLGYAQLLESVERDAHDRLLRISHRMPS